MPKNKGIFLLGATGSVGDSVLQALTEIQGRLEGFSFHKNLAKARDIIRRFEPAYVVATDKLSYQALKEDCGKTKVYFGLEAILGQIASTHAQSIVNALTGLSGLLPSLETLNHKKRLIIANKESIVCGSKILLSCQLYEHQIIPIDSEHWSIFSLLQNVKKEKVQEIIITASGGAFRNLPWDKMHEITPESALTHPVWNMGNTITISSSTLANKGLEVIEAKELFGFPLEQIQVFVHPQAKVHGMLRFIDGSITAHISKTSMIEPARNAMLYPGMHPGSYFSLSEQSFEFMEVEHQKFPMLQLAYLASKAGHSHQIIYTVGNEIGINFFLEHKIRFTDMPIGVEMLLSAIDPFPINSVEDILQLDLLTRGKANEIFTEIQYKNK